MNTVFPNCEMEGLWIHAESSACMELVLDKKMRNLIDSDSHFGIISERYYFSYISGTNGVCKKKFTPYLLPEGNR